MDECGKCGYPKLLHKEIYRKAACTQEQEVPNILKKNWEEFNKRVKPILKILKEEFKKDLEQGILLGGLTKLLNSNTENILSHTEKMTDKLTSIMTTKKSEASASSTPPSTDASTTRVSKLTKPAKVPSWTKDISLETYP